MATTTLSRTDREPDLTFETGTPREASARRAPSSRYGETQMLATCITAKPREGIDFFPLTIDVEERMYAAGKIPGSFFRREGRPVRDGDPHRAPDRPAAAAVLHGGLPRRGPGRHHRAVRRHGEPLRHRRR